MEPSLRDFMFITLFKENYKGTRLYVYTDDTRQYSTMPLIITKAKGLKNRPLLQYIGWSHYNKRQSLTGGVPPNVALRATARYDVPLRVTLSRKQIGLVDYVGTRNKPKCIFGGRLRRRLET